MADDLAALNPRVFMTHYVTCGQDTVIKRFKAGALAECQREWRALKLLAEHAPGLAPEPVSADLEDPSPPLGRKVHVSDSAVAEQQAEDLIIDDRDASYDRKVSAVHYIDPRVLG